MSQRILFVASLHHPETLQRERAEAQQSGTAIPLFPSSTALHFWAKAMQKKDYVVDVFWRNISGFASQDISTIKAEKYTNHITPQRIAQAINHRLPYQLNPDLQKRNTKLLEYTRRFQPTHVWLVGDNRVIHADTLEQIKTELACKLIYSTGTSPIVFSHAIERNAAPLFDLVITNDYYHGIQWEELGAKAMICLPVVAIDPDFHFPREENPAYTCDVGFVGTLLPPHLYSERVKALESLSDKNLGIWSVHDVPHSLKKHLRGSVLGESMLEVLSSAKISLNVHGNFMRYGGNMRLFEAASVGTFQITDDRLGIHEWFTVGEHLVTYENFDDLREKVNYYLAHSDERVAIAEAAHQHVLKYHTYTKRLETIEDGDYF